MSNARWVKNYLIQAHYVTHNPMNRYNLNIISFDTTITDLSMKKIDYQDLLDRCTGYLTEPYHVDRAQYWYLVKKCQRYEELLRQLSHIKDTNHDSWEKLNEVVVQATSALVYDPQDEW